MHVTKQVLLSACLNYVRLYAILYCCMQIYASVASTLLALMDGVADRGAVVVLGATNKCAALSTPPSSPARTAVMCTSMLACFSIHYSLTGAALESQDK